MVYPLLPALVTSRLGAGALALGVLDGAADLAGAALKWVGGRLADRPGWRGPLVVAGYAIAGVARPLIALAASASQVIGLRVADRAGKGMRTPARDALIADAASAESRGRAFGFHRAADHLGAVLGSLAAWALLTAGVSVTGVIAASAVPGVAVVVLAVVAVRWAGAAAGRRQPAVQPDPPPGAPEDGAVAPPSGGVLAALAALAVSRLPETLLLLRLQRLGVAVALIPLVWAALSVVRTAVSYPGGALSDRIGPRLTVALGAAVSAGVAALLALPLGAGAAVGVFLLFGMVAGLTEAAERSAVARIAGVRMGRGFGAYHALTGAAALPAGLMFGAVFERAGGPAALLLSAALTVVAAAGWLRAAPVSSSRARSR